MVRSNVLACGFLELLPAGRRRLLNPTSAQDDQTHIKVRVDLVQLNVAVTDNEGNYVTGLGPQDFSIAEDKIPEKIATFEAGNDTNRSTRAIFRSGGWYRGRILNPQTRHRPATRFRRHLLPMPTCLFSSIPATTCTGALSTLRMRSPDSSSHSRARARWRFTRIAVTFRAPRP